MSATAITLACAYCGAGSQPYALDADGDLQCEPGRGCARKRATRRPAVRATVLPGGSRFDTDTSADTCACGHAGAWQELLGGRLVACCPGCSDLGGAL